MVEEELRRRSKDAPSNLSRTGGPLDEDILARCAAIERWRGTDNEGGGGLQL